MTAPANNAPYPARLHGAYNESPSRWMWLVKWLLLIPHWIVLIFLYIAFAVVTLAAWFAILFTGRYPRNLFDFNVGVRAGPGGCSYRATARWELRNTRHLRPY